MSAAVRGLLSPFSVEITPRETTKLPPLSASCWTPARPST